MNFLLTIHDRNGQKLQQGDVVRISNSRDFTFYAEVKWLEKEQAIAPFHTFSFHSFEKVDGFPEGSEFGSEDRYRIAFVKHEQEEDRNAQDFNDYLSSWRECERLIEEGSYRINLIETHA